MPGVLVGFPREVSGLAVIRSLQRHGIKVSAYDCDPDPLAYLCGGWTIVMSGPVRTEMSRNLWNPCCVSETRDIRLSLSI